MFITVPQDFRLPEPLPLDCGRILKDVNIRFETAGTLNADRSNAVLVNHALTGDAHVCGKHSPEDKKPGWWDEMIGPGKMVDTNKYFVICSNVIGGCSGSTGPQSIDPDTGKPYNMNFPVITVADMVRAQKQLIDHLGIKKLLAVLGGSMGGMQVLQWAVSYPDMMQAIIPIATLVNSPPRISLLTGSPGKRSKPIPTGKAEITPRMLSRQEDLPPPECSLTSPIFPKKPSAGNSAELCRINLNHTIMISTLTSPLRVICNIRAAVL